VRRDGGSSGELIAHLRANARTFATHSFGFALSASVNYGIAAWLATFLIQTYGWTAQRAGFVPRRIMTRQGDAYHPCVELAAGIVRRVRRAPAIPDVSPLPTGPEALTQRRRGRTLIRTASRVLQPISAAVSAAGLGDELWLVARKDP